jgi:hypothetical protein
MNPHWALPPPAAGHNISCGAQTKTFPSPENTTLAFKKIKKFKLN